jgi:hypothetical protein
MQKTITTLMAVITVMLLISCGEHPCSKASLAYHLVGFSDAEADTIILRRLNKNSTVIKDSFVFNPSNPIRFNRSGNTLEMAAYPSHALLTSDHDYQLYFPRASRTVAVTEINEVQSYGSKLENTNCVNDITGCKIDNVSTPVNFTAIIHIPR